MGFDYKLQSICVCIKKGKLKNERQKTALIDRIIIDTGQF